MAVETLRGDSSLPIGAASLDFPKKKGCVGFTGRCFRGGRFFGVLCTRVLSRSSPFNIRSILGPKSDALEYAAGLFVSLAPSTLLRWLAWEQAN